MIRAIIFDFNGVIADDETPHLRCFQQALAEHGLSLTKNDYYDTHLGMDERTCAAALLTARDGICDRGLLQAMMDRKATLFREYQAIHTSPLFPGVVEFVKRAGPHYRLAIATGGRREQIDHALRGTEIERDFAVIVSAVDIATGKKTRSGHLSCYPQTTDRSGSPSPVAHRRAMCGGGRFPGRHPFSQGSWHESPRAGHHLSSRPIDGS